MPVVQGEVRGPVHAVTVHLGLGEVARARTAVILKIHKFHSGGKREREGELVKGIDQVRKRGNGC